MAHIDLGLTDVKSRGLRSGPGEAVQRTQYMLVITAVSSIIIIVVAALFISLF